MTDDIGGAEINDKRVVAHSRWVSDENILLHLYRSLIWSKLDFRTVVYGSARKSYLRMLEPVQNQALHLCLGAFRTSPATSLHIEANEMPLDLRRRFESDCGQFKDDPLPDGKPVQLLPQTSGYNWEPIGKWAGRIDW